MRHSFPHGFSTRTSGFGLVGFLLFLTVAWMLPILWVGLSPPTRRSFYAGSQTKDALQSLRSALDQFAVEQKRLPYDLGETLAWTRARGVSLQRYDGYGERLSYTRLSSKDYVIRSFGADGRQARFHGSADYTALSFTPSKESALRYRYNSVPAMDMYPAALLAGAEAPDGKWRAEVFLDQETGDRNLVVVGRQSPQKVMLAPHNRVEEFLWLPDSLRIIYTATGSHRYGDGVFLWNLIDDSVENLAQSLMAKSFPSPTGRGMSLWLSLAGINVNGPTVYLYAKARIPGAPLDPALFFNKANLTAIRLPEGRTPPRLVDGRRLDFLDSPPFLKPLDLTAQVDMAQMTAVQSQWLALSLQGHAENVLVKWQEFSQTQMDTVLFPYCLWYLSSIYAESFHLVKDQHEDDANVLRSYGAEIAKGLMAYEHGPTYLQALGQYTYMKLLAGESLPYRFARLSQDQSIFPLHEMRNQESP